MAKYLFVGSGKLLDNTNYQLVLLGDAEEMTYEEAFEKLQRELPLEKGFNRVRLEVHIADSSGLPR